MNILEEFEIVLERSDSDSDSEPESKYKNKKINSCSMIKNWSDEVNNMLLEILKEDGYGYKETYDHCEHYNNCMQGENECKTENCSC